MWECFSISWLPISLSPFVFGSKNINKLAKILKILQIFFKTPKINWKPLSKVSDNQKP